jgi:outer membrane biosynthesis protein TonB
LVFKKNFFIMKINKFIIGGAALAAFFALKSKKNKAIVGLPAPVAEPTPTPVAKPTPTPVAKPTPTPTPVAKKTPAPVVKKTPAPVVKPTRVVQPVKTPDEFTTLRGSEAKIDVPTVKTKFAEIDDQEEREYFEPLLDSAVIKTDKSSVSVSTAQTRLDSPKGTVAVQVETPTTKDVLAVTQYDSTDKQLEDLGYPCSKNRSFYLYQNNGLTTVTFDGKNGYEMTVKKNLFGDTAYVPPLKISKQEYATACAEYKKNGVGIRNSIIKRTYSSHRKKPIQDFSSSNRVYTPVTFWKHTKDGLMYNSASIDANPVTWTAGWLTDGDGLFYNFVDGRKVFGDESTVKKSTPAPKPAVKSTPAPKPAVKSTPAPNRTTYSGGGGSSRLPEYEVKSGSIRTFEMMR